MKALQSVHEGTTENGQEQEPVLSRDARVWPAEFSADERDHLTSGLAFLAMYHSGERKQFAKDAADPRFKKERSECLRIVAHHTEELHQIGELGAKLGLRNAWPRETQVQP